MTIMQDHSQDNNEPIPLPIHESPALPDSPTHLGGLMLPEQNLPPNLFILPINSPIIFPTLLAPLLITHPRFVSMIEEAINRQRMIGLLLIREGDIKEEIKPENLYPLGVVVKIIKRLKMPDGSVNLIVHSIKRFRNRRILSQQPYIVVETEYLNDLIDKTTELDALTRSAIHHVKKLAEVNSFFTEEVRLAMVNAPSPGTVADLIAFALSLAKIDAQDYLETLSVKTRFEKLLVHLRREQDVADLQKKIHEDVNTKVSKLQREFFLKEQLKSIKRELGIEIDSKDKLIRTFREKIEALQMPESGAKIALEELEKFESLSEHSAEWHVTRNYLDLLCSLPWNTVSTDQFDLDQAKTILDAEHYGLETVKERIIEFLAVRKLKADPKGSIVCLVGPPGVGKTSIGKSIAKTLGRNFFRFSLGGMRDEAEIKGHRRTYVGAMPGKIIQGLKRAGSKNPVFMLDEIDKLGQSFQGDPASALLEVLDSEQNDTFLDHYLDIPFDLSKVLFITTANTTSTIPGPLLDRMEVIELPGYTIEEKEDIACRYVIPQEMKANGLTVSQLRIERTALRRMMTDYAREPGLRSLQKLLSRIFRKAAAQIVRDQKTVLLNKEGSSPSPLKEKNSRAQKMIIIKEKELSTWLGPKRFYNEVAERIVSPGIVVGLAWTSMGGEILFIEAADIPGSGILKLTGQMGDVMIESAAIAWSYVKKKLKIENQYDSTFFKENDCHLHIPAGSIPKDGPSAGVSMATALYSLLSQRRVQHKVAMTGELSLVGKILPVGGIKEKILAARRAGISKIILPRLNGKDVTEVPAYALKNMKILYANHIEDIFKLALMAKPSSPRKKGKF